MVAVKELIDVEEQIVHEFRVPNHCFTATTISDGYITEKIASTKFPGVKYYLHIFPNGNLKTRQGQVWIYFHIEVGGEARIEADWQLSIPTASVKKVFHHSFRKSEGKGEKYCPTDEFLNTKRRYFVNGELKIVFEGSFKVKKAMVCDFMVIQSPLSLTLSIPASNLSNPIFYRSEYFNIPEISTASYSFRIFTQETAIYRPKDIIIAIFINPGQNKYLDFEVKVTIESAKFSKTLKFSTLRNVMEGDFVFVESVRCCNYKELFDEEKGFVDNGSFTIDFDGVFTAYLPTV